MGSQFPSRRSSPGIADAIPSGDGWTRLPIDHIEDLRDAVLGAGLRATQMSRTPVSGSLLFSSHDGVICSSGWLNGHVELRGPLSESMVTLGVGLDFPAGARHWLREVCTGAAGIFMPGDEHDSIYFPGSLYVAVTLSAEHIEAEAAQIGRVLDVRKLGGTGVDSSLLDEDDLRRLTTRFKTLHSGGAEAADVSGELLFALLKHFGRVPLPQVGRADHRRHSAIVRRCRDHIEENLQRRLSIGSLMAASGASESTLFRAFNDVLGETPLHYVRRRRLHRIREDLLDSSTADPRVTEIATRWGITELGRFAGWYRAQFDELPSQTLLRRGFGKYVRLSALTGSA